MRAHVLVPLTLLTVPLPFASVACGTGAPACAFTVSRNEVSARIPTVGVVEWSLAGDAPGAPDGLSSAKIVWTLARAPSWFLNRGGEAPVDPTRPNHRTLLLGLKQASDYTFHIEAVRDGRTCVSPDHALPTTGSLAAAPAVSVEVAQPGKREPGFIVTSSGTSVPNSAFIIDADGEIVWAFDGPENTTRALMDYEGANMWMLALNLLNEAGEMRTVAMDGEQEQDNVPGLETTHHDFTVMPGGKIAALAWSGPGNDPPSDLVIRAPDGTVTTAFTIGSNLYLSDMSLFHANAIHYLPFDDSFTIGDRNPNLFVKVSASGTLEWQLGGVCDGAPAGARCSPQAWLVNHGHHLLQDGTFVLFSNGENDASHVLELALHDTPSSFTATRVHDYTGDVTDETLGDVQRLPGGNTLVTYSGYGPIVELDPDWNVVQTFSARIGYSSWRPTLYGPPPRP
ncbi:MAG TPA: hypothetical protein VIF57_29675 [Polyangia bacterium]